MAVVNELLAATSREKRVHGIASVVNRWDEGRIDGKAASAHGQVEEMEGKKAAMEQVSLTRLDQLRECAEGSVAFLCERHVALLACHYSLAAELCAALAPVESWEAWCAATEEGWEARTREAAAAGAAVGSARAAGVLLRSRMPTMSSPPPPPPPPPEQHAAAAAMSLEALASQAEAVDGVPQAVHLIMQRLSNGHVGVEAVGEPGGGSREEEPG